jgi:hypothetical protein
MPDLDEFAMARLAREIAMAIRPVLTVFEDFGITPEDYYLIEKNEFYKRCKEQFALEWNSTLSTADRVKITSAAGAEQGLLTVTKRMLNPQEPFPGVLDAFKTLCRNAGIGDPKQENKASERFQTTINIGEEVKTFDKSLLPDTNVIELQPTPAK